MKSLMIVLLGAFVLLVLGLFGHMHYPVKLWLSACGVALIYVAIGMMWLDRYLKKGNV